VIPFPINKQWQARYGRTSSNGHLQDLKAHSNVGGWILIKDQLEIRLDELKAELQSGQRALADLEAKEKELRDTLSRIRGAIQVIEEELVEARTNKVMKTVPGQGTPRKTK
jgi:chromosome segregation ATPase